MGVLREFPTPSEHEVLRSGLDKVVIPLGEHQWHGHGSESLWAERTGEGHVLRNVPFFAYGFSCGDVVATKSDSETGELVVGSVTRRSGHSTYRIFVTDEASFTSAWRGLQELGCSYERATEHLFAVDVPASTDVYRVYSELERAKKADTWDFEEGHVGHRKRWFFFKLRR